MQRQLKFFVLISKLQMNNFLLFPEQQKNMLHFVSESIFPACHSSFKEKKIIFPQKFYFGGKLAIHNCERVSESVCVCLSVCVSEFVCVCMNACVSVCVCASMYKCVCMFMCVMCVCVWVCVQVCECLHVCTCVCMCVCTSVCVHMCLKERERTQREKNP